MNNVNKPNKALCVDCDGTLIATDLLYEAFFLLLKQYPIGLFLLPFWLVKGKVYLKERLAEHVIFDWSTLPYRQEIIDLINNARAEGRQTVLATASPKIWADGIANHLGCFDTVIATQQGINLSGQNKASNLVKLFGEKGFDYAGDTHVDLAVWQHAAGAIVVSNNSGLINSASKMVENSHVVSPKSASLLVYLKALRVHQWLKNLLVIVPLLAAHQANVLQGLLQVTYAFFAFSLCASAVYILNDLLDLESDRQHIRKRKRPFAACSIPLWQGMLMVPALLVIAFAIAAMLPKQFILVLAAYFIMTLAYSIRLKKQVIVDVMLLAGLYTMRIIAGAAATQITPSFWLLAFSMFIFLSLAMVKRYSELLITLQNNKQEAAGRGYTVTDLPVLMSIGVSSGIGSVLVLALYLNNPETNKMYPNTMWLWLMPPLLLYWVARMWMKTQRGQVDDDPVVFAARDWQSLVVLLLSACIFTAALKF
jgi:4-hydroxybenzoate polyprenyltransferase